MKAIYSKKQGLREYSSYLQALEEEVRIFGILVKKSSVLVELDGNSRRFIFVGEPNPR